ncbi:MAG: hypothetical protein K2P76_16470 [Lachnospiraceae bacterium]|nr:hypothetical protein [Lachnospiraceae bacterium]
MPENTFNNYVEDLGNRFDSTNLAKILLVKTGLTLYPLLNSIGIHFTEPIGLVADSSVQLQQIHIELAGFSNKDYTSLNMSKNELKALYHDNEYELFYADYYKGKTCDENLQYLRALCHSEKSKRCISIIGFCGFMPNESIDNLAGTLFIQTKCNILTGKTEYRDAFTHSLIEFIEKNQNSIFWAIRQQMNNINYLEHDGDFGYHFFNASAVVLKLLLEELKLQDNFIPPVENTIEILTTDFDHLEIDNQEFRNQFCRMLFHAVKDIPKIIDREKVPSEDIENLDKLPLYDRNYYYIPVTMLRKICKSWTETISFTKLKNLLKSAGLIVAQGSKREYCTVKVQAVAVYGNMIKIRAVKIPREKIDQPGQLFWAEVIQAKGEHYEN